MNHLKCSILFLFLLPIVGCASVSRGNTQQIHINAYDSTTNNVVAADCILTNDEGFVGTKSNKSVYVGRDKDPLNVECYTDDLAGKSVINGKINGGFFAVDFFVIDACIISCWVDGLSGSWAEYPSMIDVKLTPKEQSNTISIKEKIPEISKKINEYNKSIEFLQSENNDQYIKSTQQKLEYAKNALDIANKQLSPAR